MMAVGLGTSIAKPALQNQQAAIGQQRSVTSGQTSSALSSGSSAPEKAASPDYNAFNIFSRTHWALGNTLQSFGQRLDATMSRMRDIRPDITDTPFDLKLDHGRLAVVDDSLDERSRIWIEESMNGDSELVRLAGMFNELAVDVLDPKDFRDPSTRIPGRHYDKLSSTIDRSTRFVSLLKGVESTRPDSWYAGTPFHRAAALVERQVIADTYAYQAKGGAIELMRNTSTPPFYHLS
ncbi:hypothetical protein L2Y96_14495 [Luteibacter aegosomaticola]|uniref:hypothetical protein n=1 Tax=Luteibacter aegosomaticola TaxID=2911538 RepID=UPI001FFBA96A|nr:hypothetical protein [Luteibacter aegosomaticola]UPG88625.1 hypothetical protein L2Y96_14495 [Luteibacter aegosomaticola]